MPIISTIGRRSGSVRLVIGGIHTVLLLGAVSMIYPLMLMLTGSVQSDADYLRASPIPTYLWNDDLLWTKYVEAKYGQITEAEKAYHQAIGSWRHLVPPSADESESRRVRAWEGYLREGSVPDAWSRLGYVDYVATLGSNARRYRRLAQARYPDLADYSRAVSVQYRTWSQVGPPPSWAEHRWFADPGTPAYQLLDRAKQEAPTHDRIIVNPDGAFWQGSLRPKWADIAQYNAAHHTRHTRYDQVLLDTTPPPPTQAQARRDWSEFVRHDLGLAFIRVDRDFTPHYRDFLAARYDRDVVRLNQAWSTRYGGFEEIELPRNVPDVPAAQSDYAAFIKDENHCPLEALSVFGPRQGFEQYLAEQGEPSADAPAPLPLPAADYADFQRRKGELRWEFATRNYVQVLDYLLLHGNGIRNTVIYCAMMILVALTLDPLAAYALSRYRPPETYKVLLFCMCTMAFPAEVTMIPGFLLLKRFPLAALAAVVAVGGASGWLLARMKLRGPAWVKGAAAGSMGWFAGFWLLPALTGGPVHVSLLNTFWALVLPSAANGFSIFLLKGFFDSLPQELYEAAEIDGAGELTKFWTLTMSLSKPILAVLALHAFTAAYSEFMMALVIIPDPRMWTMMVWLFQLQNQVHPTVIYASLVVAAVPTFVVFLCCQNLIMRGIVVPVEK